MFSKEEIEAIRVMGEDMPIDEAIVKATEMGDAAGIAAAGWTIDGNTMQESIVSVVKMFDDGDPAIDSMFREPSFSGEYADDYSERQLCDDLGIDYDLSETSDIDKIVDAYLDSARDTFWLEVERLYRKALS